MVSARVDTPYTTSSLGNKCSLTNTIASLSTLTAACKGVSPRSSRHLTSAPDLSSKSTMLTCLPRIALCNGVLPNESGEFTSGKKREMKHFYWIWSNLNLLLLFLISLSPAYILIFYIVLLHILVHNWQIHAILAGYLQHIAKQHLQKQDFYTIVLVIRLIKRLSRYIPIYYA